MGTGGGKSYAKTAVLGIERQCE